MKKKIITVLFALFLISFLCFIANADEVAEWTISYDEKTLILNDTAYDLYEGYLFPSDTFSPEVTFVYENEYYYSTLERNNENLDILCVNNTFYVTKDGKDALDDFAEGKFSEYKISDGYFDYYSDTSLGWLDSLDGGKIETFNVRDLQYATRYLLLGYDKTGSVAHIIGAIYDVDEVYYFINYDKLSNNYFDANGEFSYLRGEVNAYKLNEAQTSDMYVYIENMTEFDTKNEEDEQFSGFSKGFYVTVFVLITVLIGYVAPLVPALIGAVRIFKGKTQNPKRWYLMIGLCGLWIILATCVLFTMIF